MADTHTIVGHFPSHAEYVADIVDTAIKVGPFSTIVGCASLAAQLLLLSALFHSPSLIP